MTTGHAARLGADAAAQARRLAALVVAVGVTCALHVGKLPVAIPVLRDMDAQKLAAGLQPGSPLIANLDGFPWRAQLPALAPRIISQIDGRKTVAEIYTSLGAQGGPGGGLPQWEDFYSQFEDLYIKLNGVNHLLHEGLALGGAASH